MRSARASHAKVGAGYTAVEVMISLTLLAVGTAGIISLQRGTMQGNAYSRSLDVANAIARTWVERLRADISQWTLDAPDGGGGAGQPGTIYGTKFLVDGTTILVDQGRDPADNGWFLPDQALAGGDQFMSPAFDNFGRDLPYLTNPAALSPSTPPIQFCTHVKLDCLHATATALGAAPTTCSLIRAQVRVFWPKSFTGVTSETFCTRTDISTVATATDKYHFVYATTAIRQNQP